jgi:hypothetical protein
MKLIQQGRKGIMAQTAICRGTGVTIRADGGDTVVQHHNTITVRWNAKRIVLHSGFWQTATTKLHMNQASNQFGLGFQVWQKNHEWFVSHNGETREFEDGMILGR